MEQRSRTPASSSAQRTRGAPPARARVLNTSESDSFMTRVSALQSVGRITSGPPDDGRLRGGVGVLRIEVDRADLGLLAERVDRADGQAVPLVAQLGRVEGEAPA